MVSKKGEMVSATETMKTVAAETTTTTTATIAKNYFQRCFVLFTVVFF